MKPKTNISRRSFLYLSGCVAAILPFSFTLSSFGLTSVKEDVAVRRNGGQETNASADAFCKSARFKNAAHAIRASASRAAKGHDLEIYRV